MGGNKHVNKFRERTVAKSVQALGSSYGKVWVHVVWEELVKEGFFFFFFF